MSDDLTRHPLYRTPRKSMDELEKEYETARQEWVEQTEPVVKSAEYAYRALLAARAMVRETTNTLEDIVKQARPEAWLVEHRAKARDTPWLYYALMKDETRAEGLVALQDPIVEYRMVALNRHVLTFQPPITGDEAGPPLVEGWPVYACKEGHMWARNLGMECAECESGDEPQEPKADE